ncbi:Nephrocystin-3 [Homo sapiens] [Rhizoctonia solani]|uniref:Nephrocystin-3 [Homo sapiens] n=1 Tax=Rhizoctonia solani TaxID=456999 RepID=A0A0K6GCH4_9AGAM|nr:Nephrocystin-3 [Homo sapiens] [Rhizoctonia solani]
MQSNPEQAKGLNILCIDGGGVRGLSSLIILQEFMRGVENASGGKKIHPYEHFDVIAGTGTGGISACMLGRLRMPVAKAIEKYAVFVKEVFTEKKWYGPTMYKSTKLQEALKIMIREATGDEGAMMDEDQENNICKTVVFAMAKHNLNAGLPVMFRSYAVSTNPGPNCTIREALHATMAHPELFKSVDIIDSSVAQSFVGGELGCSNPLIYVLIEVNRLYPGRQVGSIISIGAGHTRTIQVPSPSRWSRTQDAIVMKAMATDSERVAEEMAVRFQDTKNVYFRFNVDQGMQNMKDGSWERLGEATQHAKAYLQKNRTGKHLEEAVHASTERRSAVSATHAAGQVSGVSGTAGRATSFKRCPAPTKFYTGRADENEQVIECITGGKGERRVCVVYGLGGVGKTQLVLNAIERTRDEWDQIIYVDASSTESIEKALKEFGEAKNIGKAYEDVISWLESCRERWLVVFDNADSASTNIRQYIPARGHKGSVVITTRLPDLARLAEGPNAVCHLSGMNQADGVALLMKTVSLGIQCRHGNDMSAAEGLVQASDYGPTVPDLTFISIQDFGCLALAIVHAGAYIAHSPGMTIAKYRSLFLSQRQRMLDEYNNLPAMAKLDERGDTVYTTWKMCYDQLGPESRELLWLIAYLHYDGISEDIFKRAAKSTNPESYPLPLTDLATEALRQVRQYLSMFLDTDGNWDPVKFTHIIADLNSYSLIEFDLKNLTYRVHILVHDWAKSVVERDSELAVECTATLLSLTVDCEEDAESLAYKRQLELHVTSILTRNQNIGGNHIYRFRKVYEHAGHWGRQKELLELLIGDFKQLLEPEHSDMLDLMGDLVISYVNLGRYNEAEQMGVQVVSVYKRVLGEDHPDTLKSMSNLALTYQSLGRYNEAEQMGVQVVSAYKRVMGENHPNTLTLMGNLAVTYSRMGRYNEAEQMEVQIVDAHKQILGEDHPDTLRSMGNLALTYQSLGRYNEAEQMGVQVVSAYKRVLGEDHPNTLTLMGNLAVTYSRMGRYNEAQQMGVQVVSAYKRVLGEDHPDMLRSMGNLGATYSRMGRYNEAEQMQVQIVDAHKRVMGENHPNTLTLMGNLALTYSRMGRYNEAQQMGVQVVSAYKRALGEDHPDTLRSMGNLAMTYYYLGRYNEAEQMGVQVVSAYKRVLGEDHPDTLTFMGNLGATYSSMGRYNEAQQMEVQILDARKRKNLKVADLKEIITKSSTLILSKANKADLIATPEALKIAGGECAPASVEAPVEAPAKSVDNVANLGGRFDWDGTSTKSDAGASAEAKLAESVLQLSLTEPAAPTERDAAKPTEGDASIPAERESKPEGGATKPVDEELQRRVARFGIPFVENPAGTKGAETPKVGPEFEAASNYCGSPSTNPLYNWDLPTLAVSISTTEKMPASHAASAPENLQTHKINPTPSERSASSQVTSASVLATKEREFKQWATTVQLDRTIVTSIPKNPPNSVNTNYDRMRALQAASITFPRWLFPDSNQLSFDHLSLAHGPLKELLCRFLVAAKKANQIQVNPEEDRELYRSLSTIFQTCLHQKVLVEQHEKPTEMDRRITIDTLMAHICEGDGDYIVKYGTEQKLKLPKATGFDVLTTTADGVIYLDIPCYQPYEASSELREFGSAFVPGLPNRLKVVHCVAEYKRGGSASGMNRALMGIVSGLYQKKVLSIAHQLVFGVFHVQVDVLQVIAGFWQDGWIRLYKIGEYSVRNPASSVQLYLVIRGIRQLGQFYAQELRELEQELEIRLMSQPPVNEWAMDRMNNIPEDPNEPYTQTHDGNEPNASGLGDQLSNLGHWDGHDKVFAYLKSMSDSDSSSSGEYNDDPQSPSPYAAEAPLNQDKSILATTWELAGPTTTTKTHEPANSRPWLQTP